MGELWSHVGITPGGALGVMVATTALYLMYALVLALWGPRLFASSSTFSIALLTVLGGLFARAMLGDFPTLGRAIVAATTLLVLEALLGRLRRGSTREYGRHRPRVVIVEGAFVPRPQRDQVISERDLLTWLRTSGVRRVEDALVILESRGGLTVLRTGERIDARLLVGVLGVEYVPEHLVNSL